MKDIKIYYASEGVIYFVIWEGDNPLSLSTFSGDGGIYQGGIGRQQFPEKEISVKEFFERIHLLCKPKEGAEKVFRELGIVWWEDE